MAWLSLLLHLHTSHPCHWRLFDNRCWSITYDSWSLVIVFFSSLFFLSLRLDFFSLTQKEEKKNIYFQLKRVSQFSCPYSRRIQRFPIEEHKLFSLERFEYN